MEDLNLSDVLGWGYCDVEFLNNKIKEFDLSIDEIDSIGGDLTDINSWIYCTFYLAANKFLGYI